MGEIKVYNFHEIVENLYFNSTHDFVLQSDHDLEIRKLKREVELLREQRNDKLVESLGEGYNQHAGDMIKELDAEIIKATGEVL